MDTSDACDSPLVVLWLMDPTGRVTFLSPRWTEFTHEVPDASNGYNWQKRIHPHDLPAFHASMQRALESRKPVTLDTRGRRWDGVYRWLHVRCVPRFEPDGTFVGFAGATADVTCFRNGSPAASEVQLRHHVMHLAEDVGAIEASLRQSESRLRELTAHAEQVREEERRSLARTLHDELGQLFTSLKLEIAAAIEAYRRLPHEGGLPLVDRLQSAAGLLDIGLVTVRHVAASLRPAVLDHGGLVPALRWEAANFSHRTRIRCRVMARPARIDLDEQTATALYRILLEALANVARHAHAGAVSIHVRLAASSVWLHVSDNGRGITRQEAEQPQAMGITGMRERARALGGTLQIGPRRGGGSRLVVSIPVPVR